MAQAQTQTAEQALFTCLEAIQSMRAQFVQRVYDAQKKTVTQTNRGTMAILRPGKFRWDIRSPNQQLLLADGRYLWIYDADLSQATRQPQKQQNANSPAELLSGSIDSLRNQFQVSALKKSGAGEWFQLQPKSADNAMFTWVQLHFVGQELTDMRLLNNLGILSDLHFSDIEINPHLSPTLFVFKAPAGTDVLDN